MMTYTQLKMLFWMLFFITPALSVAGTEVVDIGSQQLASASAPEFTTSKPTRGVPKNYRSESAKPIPADAEEDEEDCD